MSADDICVFCDSREMEDDQQIPERCVEFQWINLVACEDSTDEGDRRNENWRPEEEGNMLMSREPEWMSI